MRSSRLMALLMLCRTKERWTAAELAEQLEVSVRTVYRDIAALQSAGVPMWTESGPGGGVHLLPGWTSQLDALTGDEAAALSLTGIPHAAAELGLGAVAMSAQLKVRSTLPPELRSRATRIEERFHLDAPGWFHHHEQVEHLPLIADAVWSSTRVDLTYRRRDREVQRRLDPLGLVMKAGTWYLVARHRSSVRTYRVARITSCAVRDERFERPDDFDLAAWWAQSSAAFDRSILRSTCTLRCSPTALRRLPALVDEAAAQRAIEAASSPDADGWRTVHLEVESDEVAADQLMPICAGIEALAPATLREHLHRVGSDLAARHAPTPNGDPARD